MCLRFPFLLITRVTAWLRLSRREDAWKTAEISILRHQLAVLQRRQPRRPKLNWADRAGPCLPGGSIHREMRTHAYAAQTGRKLNLDESACGILNLVGSP